MFCGTCHFLGLRLGQAPGMTLEQGQQLQLGGGLHLFEPLDRNERCERLAPPFDDELLAANGDTIEEIA
jgi:hypothetical protein